ncbi:hypothetical protein FHS18_005508 [Paenibacillus phyllosphaerae]|uniref:Uncharacterized protein n=1 Tax=Paenibacillus phyllosphaerae TaxID=274593 RepID=A0A7W5FQF7_9BACL|nr:CBO0543 family protein [Paenibacillus phyllosphaerae]MBB3113396.1 hypothetical protein [Paenibacillus phyllosphaerae]
MPEQQKEALDDLVNRIYSLKNDWSEYWKSYSNFDTWQFWAVLLIFLIPLLVLVFCLDRKKAFRVGFYGFAVHVIAIYSDMYATTNKMWEYPYKFIPFLPLSIGLDASLIPVAYMLTYQWTLKHRKNYYFYFLVLSIGFAFLFKPLLSYIGLFRLYQSNYLQLFMFYLVGALLSKWVTDLFERAQSRA